MPPILIVIPGDIVMSTTESIVVAMIYVAVTVLYIFYG